MHNSLTLSLSLSLSLASIRLPTNKRLINVPKLHTVYRYVMYCKQMMQIGTL